MHHDVLAQLATCHDPGAAVDCRTGADLDVGIDRGSGVYVDVRAEPGRRIDRCGRADAGPRRGAGRTKVHDNGGKRPMHVFNHDGRHGQGLDRKAARNDRGSSTGGGQSLGFFVAVDQRDVAARGIHEGGSAADLQRAVPQQFAVD